MAPAARARASRGPRGARARGPGRASTSASLQPPPPKQLLLCSRRRRRRQTILAAAAAALRTKKAPSGRAIRSDQISVAQPQARRHAAEADHRDEQRDADLELRRQLAVARDLEHDVRRHEVVGDLLVVVGGGGSCDDVCCDGGLVCVAAVELVLSRVVEGSRIQGESGRQPPCPPPTVR